MLRNIKKIVKNPYMFSVISKVFGIIVALLFTIFQFRYLGAEIKGQVATVNSIVSVTSVFFGFGIYYAYPYYRRKTDTDIMPIFLKISVLMLTAYLAVAAVVLSVYDLAPRDVAVFIITPLLVYDGIISYITLIEVPNTRSTTDMIVGVLEVVLLIVLWIAAPPSFVIGVLIITFRDVFKALIFTFRWRKRIFVHSESLKIWFPRLVKFGFFPMLSLLMTTLNYRVDILMLEGKVTDAAIGVYSVGVQLAERVWLIPDAMKGVMTSNISKGKGPAETAYVIRVCNTVCLGIALAIAVLGKPFLDLAFGPESKGSYTVTLILLFGVFTLIYYKLIAAYNIAMGKQNVSFCLLFIGVAANVIANHFLIPVYGIYGAGIASVISYTLSAVLFIVYFCRTTKISFRTMLFIDREDLRKLKTALKKR